MSPVSRATTVGRAYLDLQRLARQTKRPTDELLRTCVLERFLWRVANSDYRDQLILKGGLLLAAAPSNRAAPATGGLRLSGATGRPWSVLIEQ